MSLQGALRRYFFVFFLRHFSASLPTGIIVLYLLQQGLSLQTVGLAFALLSLTVILLEIPTGGLADAVGRKKVALAGYFFMTLAIAVLLVPNIYTLMLYPVLMGIGLSLGSGSLEAWFIDKIEQDNPGVDLQPYLAKQDLYETVASALGAIVGGAIPFLVNLSAISLIDPLRLNIMLSVLGRVISVLALVTLIPTDHPSENPNYNPQQKLHNIFSKAFRLLGSQIQLQRLLLVHFASGMSLACIEFFWQPHFRDTLGFSENNTLLFGSIMAAGFFCGTLGSLYATSFVNRLGQHSLAALGAQIFKTVILLILAAATNVYVTTVAFGLFYATLTLNYSPHMTLFNQRIPGEHRSTLLSINSFIFYIGVSLGSMTFGYLAEHYSFGVAFVVLALPTFLSSFFYLGIESRATKATQV